VTGFTPNRPHQSYYPAVRTDYPAKCSSNRGMEARPATMNRLFDKTRRNAHPLRWLGTRPVDGVRAAERRAMTAGRPGRGRATSTLARPLPALH
jgi:hypothetical protein